MCNITKKLRVSDIKEKRLTIKTKVQSKLNMNLVRKFTLGDTPIIIEKSPQKHSDQLQTKGSESTTSRLKKKDSITEGDNQFFDKYEIIQKIGEGGHSSVYKCQEKESGENYAVKITRFRDEEMIINSVSQFESNKLISNDSIVKLKELIIDEKKMTSYNVQEFCELKNLKQELASRKSRNFSEKQTTKVTKQLLQALQQLHSKGICHRDIKPENILYNPQNGRVKLIDLECSKKKKETEEHFEMWTKTGTLNYQAPQYFLNSTFTEKVDIWAAGVVAYELLKGRVPFESAYHKKTVQLIVSESLDFSSLKVSKDFQKMLKGMLEKDPSLRAEIPSLLELCEKLIADTE